MNTEIEERLERIINLLDDYRQANEDPIENNKGNYLINKVDASIAVSEQIDTPITPFNSEKKDEILPSQSNEIIQSESHETESKNLSRRNAISFDLNKQIEINGKMIPLGELLIILDKHLSKKTEEITSFSTDTNPTNPSNKNTNTSNEKENKTMSNNEQSTNKKKQKNTNKSTPIKKTAPKNSCEKDPYGLNLKEGACEIEIMLKNLLHQQRILRFEYERQYKFTKNDKKVYRRKSMFDYCDTKIPINQKKQEKIEFPSYEDSFFGQLNNTKKRNTLNSEQLKNKLKDFNQRRPSINSSIFEQVEEEKNISKIDTDDKKDSISESNVSNSNEQSLIKNFADKESAVKKRRCSSFFEGKNDDITGFNKILDIISEKDEKIIGEKKDEKNHESKENITGDATKIEEEEEKECDESGSLGNSINLNGLQI